MEFFKISRKDIRDSLKYAAIISSLTGKSSVYHWIDCIKCVFLYGCSPTQYFKGGFYKLRSFDRNNTYTRGRGYKMKRLFDDSNYLHFFCNKVDFNNAFSDFIKRSWIYAKSASDREMLSFLKSNERILVKPKDSAKGEGIYELDRSRPNEEIVKSFLGKDCLLESYIIQHPMMEYGVKSVNTIRINTVLDAQGNVHIIKAGLRCGVGNSIVDNYSVGGIVYPVNTKYGRIEGPGVSKKIDGKIYVHPATDYFMIGREIPYWEGLREMIKSAAKIIPQIRFVGWDVAITTNGPELIEGNTRPDASLIEYQGETRGLYRQMLSYK